MPLTIFYKTIVREVRKDQELVLKVSAKFGLYSIDISVRQHDFLRLTTHSEVESTDKENTVDGLYGWMASHHIYQVGHGNNDLGQKMDRKRLEESYHEKN